MSHVSYEARSFSRHEPDGSEGFHGSTNNSMVPGPVLLDHRKSFLVRFRWICGQILLQFPGNRTYK